MRSTSGGSGTLDIVGSNDGVSRVNTLSIATNGSGAATAAVDLRNNDLIVDYPVDSPIGNPTSGSMTIARWIKSAHNGGAWNGSGITTTLGDGTNYALGYAEASNVLSFSGGTATFSGQTVDDTAVLVKFTYYGDANLDGSVEVNDFSRLASNFNTSGRLWQDGDFNYDGSVNINDSGLMSPNWQRSPGLRPGPGELPPLAELYVLMLDHPAIYWESKLRPDIWWRFEQFEGMGLGLVPAVPEYLLARGIPEPTAAMAVAGALLVPLAPGRRRRPIAWGV